MDPNQQYPTQPTPPVQNQPDTSGAGQVVASSSGPIAKSQGNKLLPVLIIAGLELLVIAALVFVLVGSPKTTTTKQSTGSSSSNSQEPKAATVTSTQQTSDSISQDLSTLSDDRSFPPDQLSDKALGL